MPIHKRDRNFQNIVNELEIKSIPTDYVQQLNLICENGEKIYFKGNQIKDFPGSNLVEGLINFVEDRLGHDRRYAIDARKISKELEFVPIESFGTGLNKTVDWYINNRHWWMAILDGTYRNKNLV